MMPFGRTLLALAVCGLAVAGCSNPTDSDFDYPEATLTHMGFGFSAGAPDTLQYSNNDGDVIVWQPGNAIHPQYVPGGHVWWRNDQVTSGTPNETKDMGEVGIAKVKDIPAQWDVSPQIPPLLVGHTVVAKCRDGYAKFEVLSTDTLHWAADVKYFFTSGTSFEH